MQPLKMAVIGVGALGRHHARILSEMPGVALVGVADPREEQGRAVAEACHTVWTADYRTLLPDLDAASIVVPTTLHARVASEILRRGIPLLIEKPLTASVAEARQLVELADAHRIPLQVGHVERFNPTFQRVAELSKEPKYIRAERLSPYAFRSMDIGVVHDVMIHDIDLVLQLAQSPVRSVEAFGICIVGGQEDCVQARLRFENGCLADLTANRVNTVARRKLQVWSEAGCVDADLHNRRVVHVRPGDALRAGQMPHQLAHQPGAAIDQLKHKIFGQFLAVDESDAASEDALTVELRSFIDCVRKRKRPLVDGAQALAALEVADQILQSVSTHEWDGHPAGRVGAYAHPLHQPQHHARRDAA